MRDYDELGANDIIDTVNLIVPFVQSAIFTKVETTNGFYGIAQFSFLYHIRYNFEEVPKSYSCANYTIPSCKLILVLYMYITM